MTPKRVKVVVLGDIGRSPRMQYHSLSLATKGHKIDVIGYGDTAPMDQVKLAPSIMYHYLVPNPVIPIRLLNYLFKTVWQTLNLLFLLFITQKADYLLVQNPPAVPALLVCWIYAKIVGARLVVDWHNYGHTMMALTVGPDNPLVKLVLWVEVWVGRRAFVNFCVTKAMREDLRLKHNVTAVTLYDRPTDAFQPISTEKRGELLNKFARLDWGSNIGDLTKTERPGLIISSTSWTEDEDFGTLLLALEGYEQHINGGNAKKLPKLVCIITGKGPMKVFYREKIRELDFQNIVILTPWLESSDYPKLLACADLGICLHKSTSGLDLPMKVVDMFGCGLPVCAQNYNCIGELVKHGQNSYVFDHPKELFDQMVKWFENFGNNRYQVEREFKSELADFQNLRWQENWNLVASRVFT